MLNVGMMELGILALFFLPAILVCVGLILFARHNEPAHQWYGEDLMLQRILWLLVIILVPVIGPVAYFVLTHRMRQKLLT